LVTDAIAELGRGLRQRHVHRPAGIRAHEAGQRLWRLQCRDLLLLRRQHALAAAFFKLCHASRARRSLWRQIKIADDLVVIGRNLDMIDLRRELAHLALRLLGDLHHRLAGRLHLDEQRASEHRVGICVGVAQAIERRLTLPRREQHEHAFGWIHAGQSARHADRAFSFDREWIIAAGIEDEDYRRRALLLQPVGKCGMLCLSGTFPS